jgi:Tfp pilus assembly protein PilN
MPNDVQGQVVPTTAAPVMPRVNLMPPEIAEAARFRRLQLAMGGAVVAAAAVVGLLYVHAHSGVTGAQQQLDQANAQHTALQNQVTGLQSVANVYQQVAAKKALLTQAMGDEIRWSSYLNDLSLRIPDHVWLTSVSATETGATPTTTTPLPVGTTASIGQVTFSGVAFSHDDVATWLDVISKEHGFTNVYFSNSSESSIGTKKTVNFASTADLTDDAKSGRYSTPAGS